MKIPKPDIQKSPDFAKSVVRAAMNVSADGFRMTRKYASKNSIGQNIGLGAFVLFADGTYVDILNRVITDEVPPVVKGLGVLLGIVGLGLYIPITAGFGAGLLDKKRRSKEQ